MVCNETERREITKHYSVGSFGPFPIEFYSLGKEIYYQGQEYDEEGPFSTLEEALEAASLDFGSTDGGFHKSWGDAEVHVVWMRQKGFGVTNWLQKNAKGNTIP